MAGGMPYIFLILDLLVRWTQDLVTGEMDSTFLSSDIKVINRYRIRLFVSTALYHLLLACSPSSNHGSMSPSQLISVGNLHVTIAIIGKANTICLVGSDEEILTIFRSRSTRRPAPSNCQRTNERTTKLAVSLIIFPHPSTFQAFSFAKWRQQKAGPTQEKGLATSLQFS